MRGAMLNAAILRSGVGYHQLVALPLRWLLGPMIPAVTSRCPGHRATVAQRVPLKVRIDEETLQKMSWRN